MTREDKIQFLADLQSGKITAKDLQQKTPCFFLPSTDGTGNMIMINKFGNRVITRQQYKEIFHEQDITKPSGEV